MSNIYIQEPPALGKVLLKTTAGEIDIELWTKEAPKACRNFIQLCLEGYYNGTIFHRVVPGFIVQGGDPNGDGTGGESIYGAPFKDEFHSRLRFNRRGLVGSANAGKDDNGSQFFFTLAATPELQNKHTIFGKVTGETIYNVLKLSEGLIGEDDRPEHPHKITSTSVLINPFTDIVPRVVEKIKEEQPKKKKERQGVKNFCLLSFGEEAEEDEGEAQEYRGKPKSTHDLLEDPKLSKKTAAELEQEIQEETEKSTTEKKDKQTEATVLSIRDKLNVKRAQTPEDDRKRKKEDSEEEEEYYIGKDKDDARKKETARIKTEIKQLRKQMKGHKEESKNQIEEEIQGTSKQEDNEMYKKYLEDQEKYKKNSEKIPKKGAARRGNQGNPKPSVRNPNENTQGNNEQYNNEAVKVTFSQAVQGAFRLVLRLCICVTYALMFVYMYNNWLHTYTVILISVTVSLCCYLIYIKQKGSASFKHFRTVLVYVSIGYLLSPILHTLTDTVSTDTIYAWSVIMMLIHLIFFDYNVPAAIVSSSLSINAALFASVCLVSRLSTPFDAFILLTISVLLFVLSPQLFNSCLDTKLFNILFFIILSLSVVGLCTVSTTLTVIFVLAILFLNVYCPYLFVKWQKYKDNKFGPWAEAVIND